MKNKPEISIERRAIQETYKQNEKMIELLSDVADISQEMLGVLDNEAKSGDYKNQHYGALIVDIREKLTKLVDKKVEFPDNSDVVKSISSLEKKLDKIKFNPEIKVDAPQVNVDSPSVSVDLKGVEKILKTEMPKAFKQALSAIPNVEIPEQIDRWDEVIEALAGVEVAARLKPQMPTTLKVTNPDGSNIGGLTVGVDYDYLDVQQTDADTETFVYKLGGSGGTTVRTIVVNYTSSAKTDIDNISWS